MHIKIVGFKIHIDVEFIFQNGEMTLLKGGSGAGKSTILQAIFWALYGNMRSIYNNTGITKNLSVTLSLPGITIFRKKNPELLTVTLDDNSTYQDAIAQSVIEDRYGNRELWRSCSYIEQKSRCALLSGSGAERLELLNALSFTGENPKEYIKKISEKLKLVTSEFEKTQSSFLTELDIYTKQLEEKPVKHLLKVNEIESLKNEIKNLIEKVDLESKNVLEQERLSGKYNYILSNIKELKDKLKFLESKSFKDVTFSPSPKPSYDLEKDIEIPKHLYVENICPTYSSEFNFKEYSDNKNTLTRELNKIYEIISNKERLEKELNEIKFHKEYPEENIVNEQDIWNSEKSEQERNRYIKECESIGLEYNDNIIKQTLDKLSEQLVTYTKLEKHVGNYNKLLSIQEQMSKYEKEDLEKYEKLSKEKSLLISDLKKGLELLSCPKCNVSLRYQNNSLTLAEGNPSSLTEIEKVEKEYNQILSKINELKNLEKLEQNAELLRNSIDVELNELQTFIKSGNKVSTISLFINKISNIKYIEKVDVERLKDIYNYQRWKKKKEELDNIEVGNDTDIKNKLEELEKTYTEEQERVEKFNKNLKEYQKLENERLGNIKKLEREREKIKERNERKLKELERFKLTEEQRYEKYKEEKEEIEKEKMKAESEINIIRQKLESLEKEKTEIILDKDCKERYEECKKSLQDKKEILENAEYGLKVVENGKELEKKREELLGMQKDVQTLNKLKLKAVEIEHKQLEDTVNNINTVLQTTLPIFFNEPISLTLLLYKKVKNNVKPCLNLEICYKGCKYDNINSLSGGEGDRVSLALLLALNFVSNSPIILLDECVSSLDGDLKENCITAIKGIPNKTVVCIDHDDTIEGYYDSVIVV